MTGAIDRRINAKMYGRCWSLHWDWEYWNCVIEWILKENQRLPDRHNLWVTNVVAFVCVGERPGNTAWLLGDLCSTGGVCTTVRDDS